MKNVNRIQEVLNNVQTDVEKFVGNGNKAAGTRIRKAMQEIKTLAQDVRTEVQTIKNSDWYEYSRKSRALWSGRAR